MLYLTGKWRRPMISSSKGSAKHEWLLTSSWWSLSPAPCVPEPFKPLTHKLLLGSSHLSTLSSLVGLRRGLTRLRSDPWWCQSFCLAAKLASRQADLQEQAGLCKNRQVHGLSSALILSCLKLARGKREQFLISADLLEGGASKCQDFSKQQEQISASQWTRRRISLSQTLSTVLLKTYYRGRLFL